MRRASAGGNVQNGYSPATVQHGYTPLHCAVVGGRGGMVQELLGKGADVNNKSIHGDTPLHLAAKHGHRSVLRQLMDKGADLLCTNNAGKTPEELASARGHDQVAGILRVEAKRRGEREAFAVGQHERRGARSHPLIPDAEVLRLTRARPVAGFSL